MDLNTLMTLREPVYQPLSQNLLNRFSTESIAAWLSNRMVRENLLNIRVNIIDLSLDRNNRDNVQFFNSPHFDDYVNYVSNTVLPSYLEFLRQTNPQPNILINRVLSYLISASARHMSIPPDSAGYILGDLFPSMKMIKEATEGNCYFCSVGYNVQSDNVETREAIVNAIQQEGDPSYIVRQYIQGCGRGTFVNEYNRNPNAFTSRFLSILKNPCTTGQRDCNECIWGGNEYDSYVANSFSRPLVAINIDRNSDLAEMNLNQRYNRNNASLIRYYLGLVETAPFRFVVHQQFTLRISYVFPSYVYEIYGHDSQEPFFLDFGMPIAYMYRGNHFNAITFI